jgi:hypothetical protein
MGLSLKVEPTCGTNIKDALEGAFRIAVSLDLDYVQFEFNEESYCAYPRGSAIALTTPLTHWRRVGRQGWIKQ